jgi:hypothetical protein
MEESKSRAFSKELAQLIAKYKLRGFVGILYSEVSGKLQTAVLRLYDPADTEMKTITGIVSGALTEMNNAATGSKPVSQYRDLTGGSGKEKN